jgi:hypothetical protein
LNSFGELDIVRLASPFVPMLVFGSRATGFFGGAAGSGGSGWFALATGESDKQAEGERG